MSDLHPRLLDATGRVFASGQDGAAREANVALAALRGVVERHAPVEDRIGDRLVRFECQGCDTGGGYDWDYPDWPCSTIRVIARELGIKDEELIEKESPTNG